MIDSQDTTPEASGIEAGSTEAGSTEAGSTEVASPISLLFQRVVTDPDFKALLVDDPDKAIEGFGLSEAQIVMVKNLEPEDLDKLTPENLAEFFSADAAVYTPDEADIAGDDAYSAEDFLDLEEEYDVGDEVL
jgi:hypothetical protein